jgi:hypothetical protein
MRKFRTPSAVATRLPEGARCQAKYNNGWLTALEVLAATGDCALKGAAKLAGGLP